MVAHSALRLRQWSLIVRCACVSGSLLTVLPVLGQTSTPGAVSNPDFSVPLQRHPADQWEMALEMGYLKKIRHNSPLDYTIVPTQLAWRSPAMFDLWKSKNGTRLTVRNRFSVIAETYLKGAEDYYLAFAGAPTFELWSADQKRAIFYEIGGGAGFTNSKGVPGGQGQDLAFNWFTQLGARQQITKTVGLTGGAYFTHHSNLGMTTPNPGIDVLGVNFGVVWTLD